MLRKISIIFVLVFAVVMVYLVTQTSADNNKETTGMKKEAFTMQDKYKVATFGGGCFWGVEATFQKIKGVKKTEVGFMGGNIKNPSYKEVCYTETGHAEVVHLVYDPAEVSYLELIKTFFDSHNPTQLNYQGPDVGSQYRSVIFYNDEKQKMIAEDVIKKLIEHKAYENKIVTQIEPAAEFYKAEEYHQQYFEKKGYTGHCGIGTGADLSFLLDTVKK